MKATGWAFHRWLVVLLLAWLTAACAPKQIIVVPPGWQPGGKTAAQVRKQPPAQPSTAVPQQGSAIKEQNLPPESSEGAPTANPAEENKSPQLVASMHLVEEGNHNLEQGALDAAIALFEQAIQIDGYNGDAFFGLANAWQRRDAPSRALEFARKAEILFQDQPAKLKKVYLLEADILEGMDDWQNASNYRQKADRL
jgi:tetratricopeptide (TPR) repeat protein